MTVESLHIDCFGCLRDFSCTLGPSLNIIEGDNEAGKSTLAAFLPFTSASVFSMTRARSLSYPIKLSTETVSADATGTISPTSLRRNMG